MNKIFIWILCNIFNDHSWTSKANEEIPPTQAQLDAGIKGFNDYATMYCRHCGKISELSKRK